MRRALLALGISLPVQLAGSADAAAQSTTTSPPAASGTPTASTATQAPASDPAAELVKELMTDEADEEDLEWLFSNADEYVPGPLTGEPIRAPGLPERGEGSPRPWDPRWRKFGIGNYVLTSVSLLAAVGGVVAPPVPARWRTRNRVDEWGRRTFGAKTYESGLWARDVSDVLVSVNVTFPFLVDSLIVTSWYRRSPELAGQMALISAETIAVSVAIQGITSAIASRERPFVRDCGTKIDADLDDCVERDRYRSYFSGHTSNAFTAASVSCSFHLRHELFGSATADALTCSALYATAATTGLMRIVGQRHYVTDVLSGAVIGTVTGWAVPWLLHFGPVAQLDLPAPSGSGIVWNVTPTTNGVSVGGTF